MFTPGCLDLQSPQNVFGKCGILNTQTKGFELAGTEGHGVTSIQEAPGWGQGLQQQAVLSLSTGGSGVTFSQGTGTIQFVSDFSQRKLADKLLLNQLGCEKKPSLEGLPHNIADVIPYF